MRELVMRFRLSSNYSSTNVAARGGERERSLRSAVIDPQSVRAPLGLGAELWVGGWARQMLMTVWSDPEAGQSLFQRWNAGNAASLAKSRSMQMSLWSGVGELRICDPRALRRAK